VAANNNQVKQEPSSPSIPVKKERKSSPPVAVKQERKTSVVDDAKLAAKLQAEWNSAERPSRTGVKRKTPVAKKKKNTVKSKALVSDDSDAEPTEKKKRKVNANNAFMVLLHDFVDVSDEMLTKGRHPYCYHQHCQKFWGRPR